MGVAFGEIQLCIQHENGISILFMTIFFTKSLDQNTEQ